MAQVVFCFRGCCLCTHCAEDVTLLPVCCFNRAKLNVDRSAAYPTAPIPTVDVFCYSAAGLPFPLILFLTVAEKLS